MNFYYKKIGGISHNGSLFENTKIFNFDLCDLDSRGSDSFYFSMSAVKALESRVKKILEKLSRT